MSEATSGEIHHCGNPHIAALMRATSESSYAYLYGSRAAAARRRTARAHRALSIRARRLPFLGLPARAIVDAAPPAVAGADRLCADRGRRDVRATPLRSRGERRLLDRAAAGDSGGYRSLIAAALEARAPRL